MTLLEQVESWILELAASVWVYPAMFASATIDGFFPPMPSESVIVTLAVSAHATGEPMLWAILLVAAAGAWAGDQIAYVIGRKVGTERIGLLRTQRGRRSVAWARRALARRGAMFIVAGRYIPIGRVAVNMTAGAVSYPQRRFMGISAIAAVLWAGYSVVIGVIAAEILGHMPLLAMAVGVVGGVLLGFVVDRVVQLFTPRPEPEEVDALVPAAAGSSELA